MTNELPNLDKIEGYLNGIMPKEEQEKFELELAEDPALRKEFNIVKDIWGGVEQLGDDVLKDQISTANLELAEEGFFEKKNTDKIVTLRPKRRRIWYRMMPAASIVLVFGTLLYLWWVQKSRLDQFAANFQGEEIKTTILIDDLTASGLLLNDQERRNSLADALKLYKGKDYRNALNALSTHHLKYPQDSIAQFYLGLSELHFSNYDKAIGWLHPITPEVLSPVTEPRQVSRVLDFQHEITWYLALAFSGRSDQSAKDSTLLLLRRLESVDNPYAAKARTALQLLE